ncbi:MAG: thioredoxin domain-containing protein [Cognatishimia sp.]|uniref:DsbA family protein n=1 Tax=Cognatishimia sp. TaxID=2211648 RepID=UPI003B8DD0EB
MNRRGLILSVAALGIASFGGATWYVNRPTPASKKETIAPELAESLIRPYSPILGPEDAPVTIVEFFDPACEACRAFHPVVKDILDKNAETVRVVIRYTPFHGPISDTAVKLLEAARMQGKFEPVLNALMAYQDVWAAHGAFDQQKLGKIAAGAGLDLELAIEQMKSPDIVAIFNQDKADVDTIGVRQTPTFFINGKPLDPFGMDELRQQVDAEVAAVGS